MPGPYYTPDEPGFRIQSLLVFALALGIVLGAWMVAPLLEKATDVRDGVVTPMTAGEPVEVEVP